MYDYHVHSHFSGDSTEPMENVVRKGIQLGLKEICFTDHVEFDPAPPYEEEVFDVKAYEQEIQRLRAEYGTKIFIGMGAELGYQSHVAERMDEFTRSGNFDFIMCSLHGVEQLDLHSGSFGTGKSSQDAFRRYFEAYYECVIKNPIFNVLGHFDFLKRYIPYDNQQVFKDNYELIEATFKILIQNGKGIELNSSGFRYNLEHTLPTFDMLKLYRDLGGEIITTGSDAHTSPYLGHQFAHSHALLQAAGFKYITRFDKMEPEFIRIEDLKSRKHA